MAFEPGRAFSRYTLEAPLGAGGMGEVYRAHDPVLGRKVAIKVIHPDFAKGAGDAAARLVQEARAAAALTHPNTIAIHDLGEAEGTVFLVMELVAGLPLRAYVGDARIPLARRVGWLVDIARGLAAAHAAGLVHRDVKPSNVMIREDGIVKVLDFGLAKPVEARSGSAEAGLVVGTPGYMSPELYAGLPADARSDQYAFGVTAYELLTGMHPGGPHGAVPAALDAVVPEAGAALARVVGRTLARDREARYASMEEVAEALAATRSQASTEGPAASPSTKREGAAAPPKTGRTALGLAPTELSPAPASAARAPAPRKPSAAGMIAVLALLGFAGAWVATRLAGDAQATDEGPPATSATSATDAETAPADAGGVPMMVALPLPADAAASTVTEHDAEAASPSVVEPGASRRSVLDDFDDPWGAAHAGTGDAAP